MSDPDRPLWSTGFVTWLLILVMVAATVAYVVAVAEQAGP